MAGACRKATRREIAVFWLSGGFCWFNARMDLSLLERDLQGFHIIEVSGEIDVYTAPKLREVIISAIDRGNTRLIVDIEKVAFLDSTGLGVLVGALKRVRADNGSLDIVCTSGSCESLTSQVLTGSSNSTVRWTT